MKVESLKYELIKFSMERVKPTLRTYVLVLPIDVLRDPLIMT